MVCSRCIGCQTPLTLEWYYMKHLLLLPMLLLAGCVYAQTYVPMPVDSAQWRYRFYDVDFVTQIMEVTLVARNEDTLYGGKTYHKVFSRYHYYTQDLTTPLPPLTDVDADMPDQYYGAWREEAKHVYYLNSLGTEKEIYNFTASVGDAIPAYTGTATVLSIDSVLLADGYHRRYNTNISFFAPIEGIGSSAGLLPQLVDGTANNRFYCYERNAVGYVPPSATGVACTHVAPFREDNGVAKVAGGDALLWPSPATTTLHLAPWAGSGCTVSICNTMGKVVWQQPLQHDTQLDVSTWPRGMYFVTYRNAWRVEIRKVVLE